MSHGCSIRHNRQLQLTVTTSAFGLRTSVASTSVVAEVEVRGRFHFGGGEVATSVAAFGAPEQQTRPESYCRRCHRRCRADAEQTVARRRRQQRHQRRLRCGAGGACGATSTVAGESLSPTRARAVPVFCARRNARGRDSRARSRASWPPPTLTATGRARWGWGRRLPRRSMVGGGRRIGLTPPTGSRNREASRARTRRRSSSSTYASARTSRRARPSRSSCRRR